MKQRAALIRTLLLEPDILLLDEPFTALDDQTRLEVADDIRGIIRREKKTALLVTRDISEAISMADRVIILSARPGTIKQIIDISLSIENQPPSAARNSPKFWGYFEQIWRELYDSEYQKQ
jgi:NitT/TauT family transport system ATP-binding protein